MSLKSKMNEFAVNVANEMSLNRALKESKENYYEVIKRVKCDNILSNSEISELEDYYESHYGKKIDSCYHKIFKYFSGKFDARYITDDLGRCKLSQYANDKNYVETFSDKCFLPMIAKEAGVKMPKHIIFASNGVYYDGKMDIISLDEAKNILLKMNKFIVKPSIESGGASGCKIYDVEKVDEDLIEHIFEEYRMNFVIQELIELYESIVKLNENSYSTFRLITYILDGEIKNTDGILMLSGVNKTLSNQKGYIMVGIDENGFLKDTGIIKDGSVGIEKHPDSDELFKGYRIDKYPNVIDAAKKVHKYVPRLGIINWDFMIDKNGDPILIEGNTRNGNGPFMIQSCNGRALFGDDTDKVLDFIKECDALGKVERTRKRIHL